MLQLSSCPQTPNPCSVHSTQSCPVSFLTVSCPLSCPYVEHVSFTHWFVIFVLTYIHLIGFPILSLNIADYFVDTCTICYQPICYKWILYHIEKIIDYICNTVFNAKGTWNIEKFQISYQYCSFYSFSPFANRPTIANKRVFAWPTFQAICYVTIRKFVLYITDVLWLLPFQDLFRLYPY